MVDTIRSTGPTLPMCLLPALDFPCLISPLPFHLFELSANEADVLLTKSMTLSSDFEQLLSSFRQQ